ncbi:ATP-dependent helicase [Mycetocola reblochoni]|uniref:DNA 3'-5' helicase n=2 Tax=Mycetocola reblochoni TaxID=331618 RepID=A0A1R4J982_9MICO|nr:ATP-dependent helicase [Mycetocola reblochoni]RLP70194.1 ATP-dependent helicase [Mycetocola reblochoni]SJN28474.1 ATP-dependent DNA helicase UvrD/PcrA, actinomycete paralog [Mycetocola reblochoni REB411]
MSGVGLLDGLDDAQREAVVELRGPVRILAGAGTGKTRTITHRIAHGVATGTYAPNRVLALTFTSRAAAELRARLRALGAPGVAARTFHAAALSQLNYFWPNTIGGATPGLVDNKARLLGHAAERLKLKLDTATLRDTAAAIEWRKVSGVAIDAMGRSGRAVPEGLTLEQLQELMRGYETLKDERRQMDFEDVIVACTGMILQEASVAFQVREQFRFFVVDEYQDVSPIQQALLEAWLGERRDLCVVGDASQTIYSFTGARSDYLLGFGQRFPDAQQIRLETNYRSTPQISEAANALMHGRPGALSLHPPVGAPAGPTPILRSFSSDRAEATAIATRIASLLELGEQPESIAVLYRVHAQSAELEAALGDAGVPYTVHGASRFFERAEVKQAMMSIRAAAVAGTEEPLFKVVSDVLRSLGWTVQAPEAPGAARDRWESWNTILDLVDRAAEGTTVAEFAAELAHRQSTQHEPTLRAVTLGTIHSVKGLEWDRVFVVGVAEGLLPISYATGFDAVDEERRLLYVAITRARRALALSWARTSSQRRQREASRFLAELGTRIEGATSPERVPGSRRRA